MKDIIKKKYSPTTTALIGSFLALIGGYFIFYNDIESRKIVAYDYMSHQFYDKSELIDLEKLEILEEEGFYKPQTELSSEVTNEYIGYLTIPKINLTKGFLDSRSKENHVDKNIMVIEGSDYPDVEKGNFMIAGHSGNSWKAFFNELYKLGKGDSILIDYKSKKFIYNIKNIYTQPKTGKLAIYRDPNKTTLTLITCTNNSTETQTIYIAELVEIEE